MTAKSPNIDQLPLRHLLMGSGSGVRAGGPASGAESRVPQTIGAEQAGPLNPPGVAEWSYWLSCPQPVHRERANSEQASPSSLPLDQTL